VTAIGVGSNLLVRDGGVEGVVVRLGGPAFSFVESASGGELVAGAAVPDAILAREAAKLGISGLEFYRGIPGTVGGAITMNAGCYGHETSEVLVEVSAVTRKGEIVSILGWEMDLSYRHNGRAETGDLIFTAAMFSGGQDDPAAIDARMAEITARREQTQPIREKTGGSTFKNPPGHSSWKLVDEAGWRGKPFSVSGKGQGAMFSPLHANFLINTGEATAADLEGLGEAVRADVKARTGVELEWEIKRIGRPA
jgi:UDP-N-acetylmuramate dehydrogenase